MAPAPVASQPLSERVKTLVRHPQFVWWIGHVVQVVASLRYLLSRVAFRSGGSGIWYYRLALLGAILTYSIVIWKTFSRAPRDMSLFQRMWADENVQYFQLALFLFVSKPFVTALMPYGIFSLFHTVSYLSTNVIPTFKPEQTGINAYLQSFCKNYYERAMQLVAFIEVNLTTPLFIISVFSFSFTAFVNLVVWVSFLRYRYLTSAYTRQYVTRISLEGDRLVANQNVPPVVRNTWGSMKNVLSQLGKPAAHSVPQTKPATPNSHTQ